MRTGRDRIARVLPLALSLLALWPSGRASAQGRAPHGMYQLTLDLQMNAFGYSSQPETGPGYTSVWLQEGFDSELAGYLWKPGFLELNLRGQVFGLHRFSESGTGNGYRLGYGSKLTLLPWSIFPLSILVQRIQTSVNESQTPGIMSQTDFMILNWRYSSTILPQIFVELQDSVTTTASEAQPAAELTGYSFGQDFQGRDRSARVMLVHSSQGSIATGRYTIEERVDRSMDLYSPTSTELRQLSQVVNLDAHARLSKNIEVDTWTTGQLYSFDSGGRTVKTANFTWQTDGRMYPSTSVDVVSSYRFRTESNTQSSSHYVGGVLNWRARDNWGMRGDTRLEYTSFGPGLGRLDTYASELVSGGPYYNGRWRSLTWRVEDYVGVGGTQLNPGNSGLHLQNGFGSGLSWPVSRYNQLMLEGWVSNRKDWSDMGGEFNLYSAQTRWRSVILEKALMNWSIAVSHSAALDNRRQDAFEESTLGRAEMQTDIPLGERMNASLGAGGQASQSNRDEGTTYTLYATGHTNYMPYPQLLFTGQVSWFLISLQGDSWYTLNAIGTVDWVFRMLSVRASYEFDSEEHYGRRLMRHLFFVKLVRRFGIAF